ncbi:CPBP family intramembrane glutamic endopeptidase [Desulfoscipio gibsoniae]|uniref:CAAX amino terminal protease family n=1 Tax=Desulfoscipio gibsoniae DSM 7213 TaxID=767817 RepID=R4KJA9_9FIRM|nr:CPBP family intramembrane glutamic endopeptidase [Desulfoscipio gibsoniae]AGL00590.1 CAAX amino terminal protease family [Desulfoscipio gibsoniae DSM 7213]
MTIEKYRHPILFYSLATIIPWLFWFAAGYLSHITPSSNFYVTVSSILAFLGLLSPMIIAFSLMLPDQELRRDLFNRFFSTRKIKPIYLFLTLFLMLISILLAQAISLLFGYSVDQFKLSSGSFTAGIFSVWFILIIAPILEELAWHTYGTDCLRQRFSLFKTSLIFAIFWAFWHFPLSGIKGYYHANLVESWIYSLNFAVSLIPYVLLMNWLYYKTDRNILVAIVFHISAGFFNEIFLTHPDSKIIQTILLLVFTVFIVIKERDFFFKRDILLD